MLHFRKHIPVPILSIAAAPLVSLCLEHFFSSCLFEAPSSSALIGQLTHSVVIGQPLLVCVGYANLCSHFTWLC